MIEACRLADLPPGESLRIEAHVPIAVFNADGVLYAIDDTCTHQDASLADGWLEGCLVECPLHAASFDLLLLNHLTPLNEAAALVAPEIPIVGHLHGTELMLLEQIDQGAPAHWTHAGAWAQRMS